MSARRQPDNDDNNAAELEAFALVRPGLGDSDHGVDPDPEQRPTEGERLRALVDTSAASPDRKRALLQLQQWERQEAFLAAYAACGTVTHAAEAAGVSRRTVLDWRHHDRLGFLGRMDVSEESFADRLEAIAWSLVRRLKPGNSPVLLLAMLNAKRSAQYRPATVVDPVTARETLSELRQLASAGVGDRDRHNDQGDQGDQGAAAVAEAERLLAARAHQSDPLTGPGDPGDLGDPGDGGSWEPHQGDDQGDDRGDRGGAAEEIR